MSVKCLRICKKRKIKKCLGLQPSWPAAMVLHFCCPLLLTHTPWCFCCSLLPHWLHGYPSIPDPQRRTTASLLGEVGFSGFCGLHSPKRMLHPDAVLLLRHQVMLLCSACPSKLPFSLSTALIKLWLASFFLNAWISFLETLSSCFKPFFSPNSLSRQLATCFYCIISKYFHFL